MSDCRFGVSPVNYPDPETILRQYKSTLLIQKDFELYSFELYYCAALSLTGSLLFYVCVHPASVASLILNLPNIYGYHMLFTFHYAAKNSLYLYVYVFIYLLFVSLYLFHFISKSCFLLSILLISIRRW